MNTKIIATTLAVMLGMGTAAAQTQGVSKNEIVIGSIQDLSGPIAGLGKASRNGMQMRFDEVNEKGGVHGRKIKLVVEDHGYDPKRAVLATRKLLDQDKIFLMLAHIGTAMNEAAMPLLFEKNVINLFPFSPARQMFDPVHRLKFASLTPYYDQAPLLGACHRQGKGPEKALHHLSGRRLR
jgi:branched-chain amino acid transport system substrate-binding protein